MIQLTSGGNTAVPSQPLVIGIEWPLAGQAGLDATAYLLGSNGKVRSDADMIFYNQREGAAGAVRITSLDAGSVTFMVEPERIPADVERLLFCLTVDGAGRTLASHNGASLVVTSASDGEAVAEFEPDLRSATEAAMMFAELYRRNGWKVRAIAQGFNGGLAPLSRSLGIEVAEPAPTPALTPTPPPPLPSRVVSLTKITLDKAKPTVSLEKRGSSFGEIRINLNWSRGKRGLLGGGNAIDLDVGGLYELRDGVKGVVQALGDRFGNYDFEPFIALSGDDRSGDNAAGETIRINGGSWSEIKRIAIFAYIYEGAPNWAATDGVVTITAPDQPPIEVRMTEGRNDRGFCGIALVENDRGALKITRLVEYFKHHAEYDRRLGWGMRWAAGSKD
jgi:tellurite resistance protein TerA